ncbi:3-DEHYDROQUINATE SYNTHASE [Salix koriyanagi]|uniref:3-DEHYDROQUINATE SYNTHASE n=1 Tax=Salix koriyanagi TaxID=2511006 RepID=A0A9Q0VQL0_9ROSI|nr:3-DEHYDROQUINATE SYNTHASE [Salix koriyanagi]
MATSLSSTCLLGFPFLKHFSSFTPLTDKWNSLRLNKTTCSTSSTSVFTTSSSGGSYEKSKRVWIWTESKQVMTAAVERGWNTFIFLSNHRQLAIDWSSIALIYPLFIEEGEVLDGENKRVATIFEVSTPQELQQIQPENGQAENVVINLLDWQIIPAENIVATFQGSRKTVLAISKNHSEAQIFLEALEHGLGGVVLKVEDVEAVIKLKEYFDRRNEATNLISLTKATVTRVQAAGMGDRICVDLCSLMKPGEGLLVSLLFIMLVPLLEDYSLFTQSAWSQITLQAGHFALMQDQCMHTSQFQVEELAIFPS